MKKLLAVLMSLCVATSAVAAFNGPQQNKGGFKDDSQTATISVAKALKAKDKSIVSLQGKIIRQIDDDEFIFTDGADEIRIEVEDRAWGGQNVTPNDVITIQGKIDNDAFEKTTLDVFRVTK